MRGRIAPNLASLIHEVMGAWKGRSEGKGAAADLSPFQQLYLISIQDLTKWQSYNTARQVGLSGVKGSIEVGADADFVIWNPDETFVVRKEIIEFKNKVTPYMGRTLHGVVKETFVRGQRVWSQGKSTSDKALGKLLL
ncbi:hypothetical protein BGZ99_009941 [Dissophora globulifera]|uniref:Amidohydrolase-related domain-containing protein n=1 Tax=Dissophora globulifera TaxID=979702 RepID=A0A9P6UMQ7_9FUNG|nr:hypothetical protein BGZ99_009941 [Dissophora globulifera]